MPGEKEDAMSAPSSIDTQEVFTVEEAAAILRISCNAAYAAARLWRSSGGREGLPCIELGRTLRVPRAALDRLLVAGAPSGRRPALQHAVEIDLDVGNSPTPTSRSRGQAVGL
jgi:hypothetical protein